MNTKTKYMNKIEMYTNETCPYCKQLKEKLTKKNINFENKLTSDIAEEWKDIVNLTGIPTVHTIKCNDEYIIPGRDFQNPQQLVSLLEAFKNSLFTEERRTFERIKTLNFHINTAFGKLDQLLKQIETNTKKE